MTDNEIIKALECCTQEAMCQQCPYGAACLDDKYESIVGKDVLDLINRQKAEIERLQGEGLQLNKTFMDFVNKAKSEAIKEFSERLKEKADGGWRYWITVGDINDLVKEMAGD